MNDPCKAWCGSLCRSCGCAFCADRMYCFANALSNNSILFAHLACFWLCWPANYLFLKTLKKLDLELKIIQNQLFLETSESLICVYICMVLSNPPASKNSKIWLPSLPQTPTLVNINMSSASNVKRPSLESASRHPPTISACGTPKQWSPLQPAASKFEDRFTTQNISTSFCYT